MGSSRRNLLLGIGGIVATSGAVVGSGALGAFTAQRDANIPITNDDSALVSIEVGSGANQNDPNSVIAVEGNGNVGIDFTRPPGSSGVQTDATYQIGGIDVTAQPVIEALNNNENVVSDSGFPSPLDTGNNAKDKPAIRVRNNSTELLGVSPRFEPGAGFPSDGRILLVTRDRDSSTGGDEMRAKLYDQNGQKNSSGAGSIGGTAWRPAQVGESVGISIWIYTGTDPNADLSGQLIISAVNSDGGVIGDTN